jgi:hypothetical protein
LENINGASGSIVMEDMTDYDEAVYDYLIGYWNMEDIRFNPVLSVILEDPAIEDNELVLTGVDFHYVAEGINAISFNKAQTQDAAETAMKNGNSKFKAILAVVQQ